MEAAILLSVIGAGYLLNNEEDNKSKQLDLDTKSSNIYDLQNFKRNKTKKVSSVSNAKTDDSGIPKNTLRLIEEAEKSNN